MHLQIIVGSTRPGRGGLGVAQWFADVAGSASAFNVELVDLVDYGLPLLDEPEHPRLQNYQNEHTKRWSATIDKADAYVFVTPEYNYGTSPALLNALDYLVAEWAYKPAGIVSYGGVSGGLRGAQHLKTVLNTLKIVPLMEGVPIPAYTQHVNDDGRFKPGDQVEKSAQTMLAELARWATALGTMRS